MSPPQKKKPSPQASCHGALGHGESTGANIVPPLMGAAQVWVPPREPPAWMHLEPPQCVCSCREAGKAVSQRDGDRATS